MLPLAKESKAKIVWLSKTNRVGPHSIVRLFWKLLRNRPQMLYTLTVVPNIWGRILGKIAGIEVIISGYRSLLPRQYERWLWPLSSKIICNAKVLKEKMTALFSVDPSRITVIPNAVDTDSFSPDTKKESADPTVLYVGRLVEDKAPSNLLEAFKIASERIPSAKFQIVGDGHLRKKLEGRIKALSLESRITIIPGNGDIITYMRNAWVFALASDREASPNVIIEAMATGLPVVATRVGGVPELIDHGKNGLLVAPGNPKAFSDAIVYLLTNASMRRDMGLMAREKIVANHSLPRILKQTEQTLLAAFEKKNG